MLFRTLTRAALAAVAVATVSVGAQAANINGAGATFPFPIYSKWADAYKKETGTGLIYQSIGSGAGIKQIQSKTVTFGATDIPQSPDDLKKWGMVQWPMVMGGIVAVVNIDGVKPGDLVLDGSTLADIFLGKIKTWDDPAIAKLNGSLKLPSAAIAVVHRADGSGTSFNFTNYLSKASEEWGSKIKFAATVEWPVGVGAKGNEGVAGNVAQTKNSIGYVEYAYAKQNKLTYADMINKAGKKVSPTLAAFQAAAANAKWDPAQNFYMILSDQPGDESWPMTAATFILMYKEPQDKAASADAIKFFDWAFKKGGKMAEELDYIPIPDSVVTLIESMWNSDIMNK
ncbi:MAG: phosphate ABC transporter substrate-binding protein PstS [Methylobacteriaceae bacterium]|nr:phosphate ABC transporter substrate-binding protein PstS [Methylobacteriaceae bacterium]